ncbi:MAG: leucyl/phenylalanyl-tRNA--protein transferase [Candidatus Latescibacterota bacterium]|jgi:leucyl/phenylalanyl-tRNA--protein transferase
MYYIDTTIWFPEPSEADSQGLLAVGGDLSMERLWLAYQSGIFPWYEKGQPLLWWSPDPRMVLFPKDLKVSKSLQKQIKKNAFKVTFNTAFEEVIKQCALKKRAGQDGTWITDEMIAAYIGLFERGDIISVEVWLDNELVGGLYGVNLRTQRVFCGESMFSAKTDASKIGFYFLVNKLLADGYKLIDCQMHTAHLASLGALEIPRKEFLKHL